MHIEIKLPKIILILVSFAYSSLEAKSWPTDWTYLQLSNQPLKMTEFSKTKFNDFERKDIYYFNNQGYLIKIEHFNHLDHDSLKIGSISYVELISDTTKKWTTVSTITNDTLRIKEYRLVNNHHTFIIIHEKKQPFQSLINHQYDSNLRIKVAENKIIDTFLNKVKVFSKVDFYYLSGLLDSIKVTEFIPTKGDQVTIIHEKRDNYGNVTRRKYINREGELVYSITREYVYES